MIDPKKLALQTENDLPRSDRAPQHRKGERFLRGPIPMAWICTASKVCGHGRGLNVAIALWFLSGLNNQKATVTLKSTVLRDMGIDRHAAYRGLEKLEKAGLVSVERNTGRLPIVTLLPLDTPS